MIKIQGKNIFARLEGWAVMLILVLLLAFMLFLSISAWTETSYLNTNNISGENIDIYADNVFLNIIMGALSVCLLYIFYQYADAVSPRLMELMLYGWMFVFGCLFILTTKLAAPVYSDSYIVTNAAMDAAFGEFYSMESYFARFPFQLGYVFYCEVFFRLMLLLVPGLPEGYYYLALQCGNLVWLILSYFALLRIAALMSGNPGVHRLSCLLMIFSIQPLMSCTFLYGNIPAFACGVFALWMFTLFIKGERLHHALLCALGLSLAVLLKLNLMIFLVAVGGVWLVELVKKFSLKSCLSLVLCVLCVLSISKLPQQLYEKRSGYDFGEGIPMLSWLAMGMDEGHAAAGWYKEEHTVEAFKLSGNDPELTSQMAKAAIKERAAFFASHPGEALRFFSEKLRSQWNEPSYDSLWLNQVFLSFSEKGGLYNLLCNKCARFTLSIMNQHQQMVFFGALLAIIALMKKRDILSCSLPLIILGGFMYHLLFEAKSQYALPYFILMLPLSAYGLGAMFEYLRKKVS